MPSPPDHMQGIDALVPRWDPNNPTTYRYDWRDYDRADYEKFRKARAEADRKRQEKSERDHAKSMEEVKRFIKGEMDKGKELEKDAIKKAALAGGVLTITTPSSCFASVTWEADGDDDDDSDEINGTVTGKFHRGGKITYDGPMTLDEFIEWSSSDSIGAWYNQNDPF